MLRNKVKIPGILILLLAVSSCSVSRKIAENNGAKGKTLVIERFLNDVRDESITKAGFRIDKIKVSATVQGETRRFSGNIKVDRNGSIQLSVRAIAGIELARIYIDSSRVVVLDRINREFSEGNSYQLLRKYGLEWEDINMIFGNVPELAYVQRSVKCKDGSASINANSKGRIYLLGVDCKSKSLSSMKITNEDGNSYYIEYSGIKKTDGGKMPEEVKLKDMNNTYDISVEFDRLGLYDSIIKKPGKPSGYSIGVI